MTRTSWPKRRSSLSVALFLALPLVACERPASKDTAPTSPAVETKAQPVGRFGGRIEGVIRLAEGVDPPQQPDPFAEGGPGLVEPPAPCSPVSAADRNPLGLGEGRVLSNVHVALTRMSDVPEALPRTHEIHYRNCRPEPVVLGARRGDTLALINDSEPTLLPTLTGEPFMPGLLPAQRRTIPLKRTGVFRVACGFGAYCGVADVLVTSHKLFGVSDAAGRFVIHDVPIDEPLSVHAFHPLLSVAVTDVTLSASEPVAQVELRVRPARMPAEDAAQAESKSSPR